MSDVHLVEIDEDNYKILLAMVSMSVGIFPVSVSSLVNMAVDAFIQGAVDDVPEE